MTIQMQTPMTTWGIMPMRCDLVNVVHPFLPNVKTFTFQGDGNSGGSLSSLNSGTDDADLEFEYLHNFGPRFAMMILLIIHSKEHAFI